LLKNRPLVKKLSYLKIAIFNGFSPLGMGMGTGLFDLKEIEICHKRHCT
jgi:hypothetical protein